jgi:hypothetical protein
VRYAICNIVMQRVVGMTHVDREDQHQAYAYALAKLEAEKKLKTTRRQNSRPLH